MIIVISKDLLLRVNARRYFIYNNSISLINKQTIILLVINGWITLGQELTQWYENSTFPNTKFHILMYVLIVVTPFILNAAIITLVERKILGLSQNRLGPTKVGVGGLLQPFRDAIKLLLKGSNKIFYANPIFWSFAPCFTLWLRLILVATQPSELINFHGKLTILLVITILAISVYGLLLGGWASNSKYRIIGAIRRVAQTISYEIILALIFMFFIIIKISIIVRELGIKSQIVYLFPCGLILLIVVLLAETHRTPFDFAEGESELVSGYNVEYGGVEFTILFLAEYLSIVLFSSLTIYIIFRISLNSPSGVFITILVITLWIQLRATLPRYRYDKIIKTTWINYLPITLFFLAIWLIRGVYTCNCIENLDFSLNELFMYTVSYLLISLSIILL